MTATTLEEDVSRILMKYGVSYQNREATTEIMRAIMSGPLNASVKVP